jgi:NADH-quinone oxidoreductase subunit L
VVGTLASEFVAKGSDPSVLKLAWLVPVIPLVAAPLIAFFGKRLPFKGAELGLLSIGSVFVLAMLTLGHFITGGGPYEQSWSWATIGSFHLQIGVFVDGLTAVMFAMVAVVSFMVQMFSVGYMHGDRRYPWFFAVLALFTGAMLDLVVANNFFQLLVGWEGVGICSYLIIGFWWEEKVNTNAANKAFLTTRFGDVGMLFGFFVLIAAAHTANIPAINGLADAGKLSSLVLLASGLLIFCGAVGKSAQFPLHVWLPDAMAGPTPASALIHAATMVVAGVYLVARMFPIYIDGHTAITVVATIGSITMVLGAVLALAQDDIKRVLAYSTISQIAYMIAALGLGEAGYTAGLFHMFTHAFFKSLLFLGAGSIIHSVHSNNMSDMGGLRKHMPVTYWTFLIGSLALMGVPPFAGFWSKDGIIAIAFSEGNYFVWIAALLTAVLTAFYMTRALLKTFAGEYRGEGHPHESGRVMTVPMVILAACSVFAGFIGAPKFDIGILSFNGAFANWVHVTGHLTEESFNWAGAGLSVAAVLLGAYGGYRLYRTYSERDPLMRLGGIWTALEHRLYIDEAYMRWVVRPIQYSLSASANWVNRVVLDGAVNGVAGLARGLGVAANWFDRSAIDGAVNTIGEATGETGGLLRYLQSGNVQRYAVFLFVGIVALVIVFTRV